MKRFILPLALFALSLTAATSVSAEECTPVNFDPNQFREGLIGVAKDAVDAALDDGVDFFGGNAFEVAEKFSSTEIASLQGFCDAIDNSEAQVNSNIGQCTLIQREFVENGQAVPPEIQETFQDLIADRTEFSTITNTGLCNSLLPLAINLNQGNNGGQEPGGGLDPEQERIDALTNGKGANIKAKGRGIAKRAVIPVFVRDRNLFKNNIEGLAAALQRIILAAPFDQIHPDEGGLADRIDRLDNDGERGGENDFDANRLRNNFDAFAGDNLQNRLIGILNEIAEIDPDAFAPDLDAIEILDRFVLAFFATMGLDQGSRGIAFQAADNISLAFNTAAGSLAPDSEKQPILDEVEQLNRARFNIIQLIEAFKKEGNLSLEGVPIETPQQGDAGVN